MKKKSDKALTIKELAALPEREIDYSDIPELNDEFWDNAIIRAPENKQRLTVRLDADVVAWFKSQGRGYQTKMNAVLRSFYESQNHR